MGSQQMSGFNEAAAGSAALNFNVSMVRYPVSFVTSNSWWYCVQPTDRTKLPYSLTGAKGWKLRLKIPQPGTSIVFGRLYGSEQLAAGIGMLALTPAERTAYVDITGPVTIYKFLDCCFCSPRL
jgi:hypothetical protein